ncbi:MAG: UDP-N-acetylglucosamine 2-epimerase [Parcubacteria group bacterium Gr01-1014_30]|nr:MAG: UDP-N-acetylglucosamine 2-epimerase [Parcubacteria group bacterium Gr01-1014_30]
MKFKKKKIAIVAGARPNFVKIAQLVSILRKHRFFDYKLFHTGQHFDFEMSQVFFQDLKIPKPHFNLNIRSGKHPFTTQIALIKKRLQEHFNKEQPDLCLVFGDANSAIGGALAAHTLDIPVGHIEAGLRSFDRTMSEESNRLVTDLLSRFLFTHSESANKNLSKEGHSTSKMFFVGNTMIDALVRHKKEIAKRKVAQKLGFKPKEYGVLTLHRYNNTDIKPVLDDILQAILMMQTELPLVFPIHPSTKERISFFSPHFFKQLKFARNLHISEPVGYLDSISLLKDAKIVLTDSGGVQEETTFLGVPCVTLRQNTERPITVTAGTNVIGGITKDQILSEFGEMMQKPKKRKKIPPLWDGKASLRIVRVLEKKLL